MSSHRLLGGEGAAVGVSLETEIKAYALKVGFDVVAIGSAEPYKRAERELHERRERGHYPAFTEPDIALRCHPDKLLPSARSVIALGVSYLTDDRSRATRAGDDPKGQMSRYAWGLDYHPLMRERMQQLLDFIENRLRSASSLSSAPGGPVPCGDAHESIDRPDSQNDGRSDRSRRVQRNDTILQAQAYVDTGPPLDREVASEAGLGWFGKNSMLYVPDFGSWVFLGQIFTNLDLAADPTVSLDCGDCDICIRACPTDAITAPFYVQPDRCISHLTQMSGSIPEELRAPMGLKVWGCDICQQVCPWNDEAVVANRPEFRPIDGLDPAPSLIHMLHMSNSEFRGMFGPTAAAWRGKRTLQRNAAIALGNTRNPKAIPALTEALEHDLKPLVRGSAAWALGRIAAALTDKAKPGTGAARPKKTAPSAIGSAPLQSVEAGAVAKKATAAAKEVTKEASAVVEIEQTLTQALAVEKDETVRAEIEAALRSIPARHESHR